MQCVLVQFITVLVDRKGKENTTQLLKHNICIVALPCFSMTLFQHLDYVTRFKRNIPD